MVVHGQDTRYHIRCQSSPSSTPSVETSPPSPSSTTMYSSDCHQTPSSPPNATPSPLSTAAEDLSPSFLPQGMAPCKRSSTNCQSQTLRSSVSCSFLAALPMLSTRLFSLLQVVTTLRIDCNHCRRFWIKDHQPVCLWPLSPFLPQLLNHRLPLPPS